MWVKAAQDALDHYTSVSGSQGARSDLIDLMTDLLHLAELKGCDPGFVAEQSREHYRAESPVGEMVARLLTSNLER